MALHPSDPAGYTKRTKSKDAPMAKIEIYTTALCPYCYRAKALLNKKGVAYAEYAVDAEPSRREEMVARAPGARTVPQIFIDDQGVGGCDDLYELESKGKLDALLGRAA